MIRFIILSVFFCMLYLGFNSINNYDYPIEIFLLDYKITITLFFFITIFLLIQLIFIIFFKSILGIVKIPKMLIRRWRRKKLIKFNDRLLFIISRLLIGKKDESISATKKILSGLDSKNQELINLIMAETNKNPDTKTQYFRQLVGKKYYNVYASKKIAEIFYENKNYKEAKDYAIKAFNANDTDTEIIFMLINIYASMAMWHKLVFLVSKLERSNKKLLRKHAKKIAIYYFQAADHYFKVNDNDTSLNYLELALRIKPDYSDALKFLLNFDKNERVIKILENAFLEKPSVEIAKIYMDNSDESKENIYNNLSYLVKPSKYYDLFLAIAAHLELFDKISEIKKNSE